MSEQQDGPVRLNGVHPCAQNNKQALTVFCTHDMWERCLPPGALFRHVSTSHSVSPWGRGRGRLNEPIGQVIRLQAGAGGTAH